MAMQPEKATFFLLQTWLAPSLEEHGHSVSQKFCFPFSEPQAVEPFATMKTRFRVSGEKYGGPWNPPLFQPWFSLLSTLSTDPISLPSFVVAEFSGV